MAIILLATFSGITAQRDMDPCRYFPDGTVLRHHDDCSKGVTCINLQSVVTITCSGSTPFFDKETGKCAKSLADDSSCEAVTCKNSAAQYIADPKSCFGFYYCLDEESSVYGHCPDPYHFNVNMQQCVYSADSECSITNIDFCAIAKTGTNFNDESDCTKYFTCAKTGLTSKACSKKYYDSFSGTCVEKSKVDCKVHPYPSNVCGTVEKPKKNVFVGDGATCRGYYFCKEIAGGVDNTPQWMQCPQDKFFNSKLQACDNPLNVKCTEDRCDGRTKALVVSGKKGCRDYLRCENGVTVDEDSCGNYFFDEDAVHCTSDILQFPACV